MTQNFTEERNQFPGSKVSGKSPLIWIFIAAVAALGLLLYIKDKKVLDPATSTPLFNPPSKSQQQLDKESEQDKEENDLKQKF